VSVSKHKKPEFIYLTSDQEALMSLKEVQEFGQTGNIDVYKYVKSGVLKLVLEDK